MPDKNIVILNQLTAVNLNVSIWSAKKKLTAEDFGSVELPPEELTSLGNKKICDPEHLRIFSTLKARAVNQLDRIGVRFLGGWAINDNQTSFIYDRLLEVKNEFLAAKDSFLANYDMAVKSWADKHQGWERLIADSPVSAEQVGKRMSFNWQFFKVVPPQNDLASRDLLTEVNGLGATLLGEIAKEAKVVWDKVYAGKTKVSHKALSPLKTLRQKLAGLSFVEPTAVPAAALIDEAMSSLPKRGIIKGQHLTILQGLVSTLRDSALLSEHGQKVIGNQASSDVFSLEAKARNGLNTDGLTEELYGPKSEDESSPFELSAAPGKAGKTTESNISGQDDEAKAHDKRTADVPYMDSLGLW
jgi:hypothetical protein